MEPHPFLRPIVIRSSMVAVAQEQCARACSVLAPHQDIEIIEDAKSEVAVGGGRKCRTFEGDRVNLVFSEEAHEADELTGKGEVADYVGVVPLPQVIEYCRGDSTAEIVQRDVYQRRHSVDFGELQQSRPVDRFTEHCC